ncbi:hypothetical protein LAL4801_04160 [Roseibium aggregatum]|uniref:Uncharacterized protein n=1 Tax=Roseibium aggregatum TaxID=187304 RepID=A0A0M6Y6H9_9HYPH|nr:hypothetical protein LAL4801_04160 [Roseibium aggregatum]
METFIYSLAGLAIVALTSLGYKNPRDFSRVAIYIYLTLFMFILGVYAIRFGFNSGFRSAHKMYDVKEFLLPSKIEEFYDPIITQLTYIAFGLIVWMTFVSLFPYIFDLDETKKDETKKD